MRRKVHARRALVSLSAGTALVAGLSACGGVVKHDPNLIAGKRAFVAKCGACHKLNRAGTTGVTGPDLDQAFQRSLVDGMKRSTVEGVVLRQIGQPNRRKQMDPQTLKPAAAMPANLVKGGLAEDVAAYVASVSAKSARTAGAWPRSAPRRRPPRRRRRTASSTSRPTPVAAWPTSSPSATAQPGSVTLESKNDASIPHNIAIEGNGLDQKGEVVQGGGTSKVQVDLKVGEYTFFCSVPGHRDGGMVGKITVSSRGPLPRSETPHGVPGARRGGASRAWGRTPVRPSVARPRSSWWHGGPAAGAGGRSLRG